ncbi:MAG: histidine phosphatase family protein [Clostridia bacterium]|nr:histidine phosphatase family protein [Clostridia bacterium]
MKLLLVRHAEPDYSIDSLTPKGRREADLLAGRLSVLEGVEGWYVSPLGRARDTAAPTMARVGREAEVLPWLCEFRARPLDPVTGKPRCAWDYPPRLWTAHEPLRSYAHWTEDPLMQSGNVQTVWEETKAGVDALLARHGYVRDWPVYRCENNRKGTIVCFCHFGIGSAILAYLTGISPVVVWQNFCMQPSSVTTLITEERVKGEVVWRCMGYGDLSHLWAAGEPCSTAALFAEVYDGIDTTEAR